MPSALPAMQKQAAHAFAACAARLDRGFIAGISVEPLAYPCFR
jgi:hypothetical protein